MNQNSLSFKKPSVQWLKLLLGLTIVFALFQWTATALGSDRGQFGVLVGLFVVTAIIFTEKFLFGKSFKESIGSIGLKLPTKIGLLTAIIISALMFLAIFIFAMATGSVFSFYPDWYWLVPGLFFQAGIAEETLFRGYLFRHLRRQNNYWKAAVFAAIPFVLVHLILFYSLPPAIALASIFLSVVLSFPLSRLFELDGNSVWAPAIIHFVVQGTVKILVAAGESAVIFPLFWIIICAIVPLSVFVLPNPAKKI